MTLPRMPGTYGSGRIGWRRVGLGVMVLSLIVTAVPSAATASTMASATSGTAAATAAEKSDDEPRRRARQDAPQKPSLTVNVTDTLGQPVPQARVTFLPFGLTSRDNARNAVMTLHTTAHGDVTVPVARGRGLPPGRYAVLIRAAGRPATWIPQTAAPEQAAPVDVSSLPGQQQSFVMRDPVELGTISGFARVRAKRTAGVFVSAYHAISRETEDPVAAVPTDADGRFTLHVPPGRYKVVADGSTLGLLRRWSPGRTDFWRARAVRVTADRAISGINLNLNPMSTLPRMPRRDLRDPKPVRRLTEVPVDGVVRYQPQRRCHSGPQAGTLALRRLLLRTYGREEFQMMRGCRVGDTSEHKDGRAMDWMVRAWRRSEAVKADNFALWATRSHGTEHGAMARRLGIMYIIWRGRIWGQYDGAAGWRVYRRCNDPDWSGRWSCHFDHMHISMNRPGGRRLTSWWTGRAWR